MFGDKIHIQAFSFLDVQGSDIQGPFSDVRVFLNGRVFVQKFHSPLVTPFAPQENDEYSARRLTVKVKIQFQPNFKQIIQVHY